MDNSQKLNELGINVLRKLESDEKEKIAKEVTIKLNNIFIKYNLLSSEIYEILVNTDMYLAEVPQGISPANYIQQNSSLYFSEELDLNEPNEYIIHECIHRIQDYKNKKKKLKQLGICYFTETKINGLAINEAAIQYVSSKALNRRRKYANVYDMDIKTLNPKYFPVLTNIIEQLVFILGEEKLVDSLFNNNNEFRYNLIDNLR